MRKRPLGLLTAVSGLSAAALTVLGVPAAPALGHTPASPAAHVWVTTPDGSLKMADQGTVSFGSTAPSYETVVVDASRRFQTMTGFGGSITDSSASVLYGLSPSARSATMKMLFDPRTGDGLDFLRQPVGASDFATQDYTFDDLP